MKFTPVANQNSRRLLLVALDYTRPKDPPISLGQASILANLKQHKINVLPQSYAVNNSNFNLEKINRIQTDIPHVIESFSFNQDDWKKMADIAEGLEVYNNRTPSSVAALKKFDEVNKLYEINDKVSQK